MKGLLPMQNSSSLFLASQSPRRLELLAQLGLTAETVNAPVEEVALPNEPPESFVQRMAIEKAMNGFNKLPGKQIWVIGGDTVVVQGEKVFGKPRHREDAMRMWRLFSGRSHRVLTSVALVHDGQVYVERSDSTVTFKSLTDDDMHAYWSSGEPVGKAGAYAIQGLGAKFVQHLDGSFSGVMGLPLYELNRLLEISNFYRNTHV